MNASDKFRRQIAGSVTELTKVKDIEDAAMLSSNVYSPFSDFHCIFNLIDAVLEIIVGDCKIESDALNVQF